MRRSLLLPLALLASPALASEPAASPSFYIERDDTDQPAVSRDGDVQLVVWTDRRAGATTGADIYGARIRVSDGAILDPGGFPICVEPGDQVGPRLAGDAGTFLVAWTDHRDGNDDIYAARVRGNTVLDGGGFVVSAPSGGGDQLRPFVASGAGRWLVAWEDWRRSATHRGEVFVARVDADANVLDGEGIRASTGDGETDRLGGLVSNGDGFVAIHTNGTFANVSLVWEDGRVAPEIEIGGSATPFSTGATAIATDGHAFLALWNHYDETGRALPELRARLLSADVTPSGASFRVGDAYDDPAAAWTGCDYLVVNGGPTETGHALFGARVAADGTVGGSAAMMLARDAGSSSAAGGDGTVLVVAAREDDVLAVGVSFDGAAWTVVPADDPDSGSAEYDGDFAKPIAPGSTLERSEPGAACSVASGPHLSAGVLFALTPLGIAFRRRWRFGDWG